MAEKPLMVKAGPRSAGQKFAFRVKADMKLEFTSDPVRVERTLKTERIRRNRETGKEDIEAVEIDLARMIQRYADAGYLEIVA